MAQTAIFQGISHIPPQQKKIQGFNISSFGKKDVFLIVESY